MDAGYRHEPHNKVDRHKAADAAAREEAQEPSYEPYTKPPTGSAIGQPVEGRLGGGEETIYSPIDGPPLYHSAPTPRS